MTKFKSKYFYGWNIVFIMAITSSMTMALGTLNFGLFIKPMGDELQIGRSFFVGSNCKTSSRRID